LIDRLIDLSITLTTQIRAVICHSWPQTNSSKILKFFKEEKNLNVLDCLLKITQIFADIIFQSMSDLDNNNNDGIFYFLFLERRTLICSNELKLPGIVQQPG
jgi:hypothetical protein